MNAYSKIRAALEHAHSRIDDVFPGAKTTFTEALAALAELECAAAEPLFLLTTGAIGSDGEQDDWEIECDSSRRLDAFCAAHPGETVKLYTTPPPAPVAAPQFEAVEVTDEVAESCVDAFNASDSRNYRKHGVGRRMIAAVRAELGPTLGMMEIREPTADECERILSHFASPANCTAAKTGRAMFDAVRAVMEGKS